jgi:hypothetical protein
MPAQIRQANAKSSAAWHNYSLKILAAQSLLGLGSNFEQLVRETRFLSGGGVLMQNALRHCLINDLIGILQGFSSLGFVCDFDRIGNFISDCPDG